MHGRAFDFAKKDIPWVDALCEAIAAQAGLLAKGADQEFSARSMRKWDTPSPAKGCRVRLSYLEADHEGGQRLRRTRHIGGNDMPGERRACRGRLEGRGRREKGTRYKAQTDLPAAAKGDL